MEHPEVFPSKSRFTQWNLSSTFFFSLQGEFLYMSQKHPFLLYLGVQTLQTSHKHICEVEWELLNGIMRVYIV